MSLHACPGPRHAPASKPRQVLLFAGHMVDAPGRAVPRFPAAKEHAAALRIAAVLDALHAGPEDLAITQGASGGDLLFAEACVLRGVPLQLLLPLPEAGFIARSMLPSEGGPAWRDRYLALKTQLGEPPCVAEEVLGPLPPGDDPWERANHWLLRSAMAHGADKLHLITLWDGGEGDGRGGTGHMVREVRRLAGHVHWIDLRSL
jgi:hypothetical protein